MNLLTNTPSNKSAQDSVRFNEAGEELKKNPMAMPGYGQIFLRGEEAWYVGGDGDEDGFSKVVEERLKEAGASKVRYEAEGFPPRDEGWRQLYPKNRDWVSNANPEGCNQHTGPGCQRGVRAARALESLNKAKAERKAIFDELRGEAEESTKRADAAADESYKNGLNRIAADFEGSTGDAHHEKFGEHFSWLDENLNDAHSDSGYSAGDRFGVLKEAGSHVAKMQKLIPKLKPVGDEETGRIEQADIDENKVALAHMATKIEEAKGHLRDYAATRKEMRAIKNREEYTGNSVDLLGDAEDLSWADGGVGAPPVANAELVVNPPGWDVDEHKWERAKQLAAEAGRGGDYAYITGIYKKMHGPIKGKVRNSVNLLANANPRGCNQYRPCAAAAEAASTKAERTGSIGHHEEAGELHSRAARLARQEGKPGGEHLARAERHKRTAAAKRSGGNVMATVNLIANRDFSTEQREKLADQGKAMPGGGFPIATAADLKNAVQAFGRAGDKAAAKAHIIKRARALGLTSELPEGWVVNIEDQQTSPAKKCKCGGSCEECAKKMNKSKAMMMANAGTSLVTNQQKEAAMPTRAENVAYITANCACMKGKEAVLNDSDNFTDEEVNRLRLNAEADKVNGIVANKLREGVTVNGQQVQLDDEGYLTVNAFGKPPGAEDDEDGDEMPMKGKKKATCNTTPSNGVTTTVNPPINVEEAVANHFRKLTPEQWIAMAPPQVQELLANARETVTDARRQLVEKLVANVADPEKKKLLVNRFGKMTLEQLKERFEEMSMLAPAANAYGQFSVAQGWDPNPPITFDGASGVVGNQGDGAANSDNWEDQPLVPPTLNWEEEAKALRA